MSSLNRRQPNIYNDKIAAANGTNPHSGRKLRIVKKYPYNSTKRGYPVVAAVDVLPLLQTAIRTPSKMVPQGKPCTRVAKRNTWRALRKERRKAAREVITN